MTTSRPPLSTLGPRSRRRRTTGLVLTVVGAISSFVGTFVLVSGVVAGGGIGILSRGSGVDSSLIAVGAVGLGLGIALLLPGIAMLTRVRRNRHDRRAALSTALAMTALNLPASW